MAYLKVEYMNEIDPTALDTSSQAVRAGVQFLEDEFEEEMTSPNMAIYHYVLDQFNCPPPEQFLNNWWENEGDPKVLAFEESPTLALIANLLFEYSGQTCEDSYQHLDWLCSVVKSNQSVEGDFALSAYNVGGPLWLLSQVDPEGEAVRRTLEYIQDNTFRSNYWLEREDAAAAILGLCNLGYYQHEDLIHRIGERLIKSIKDVDRENRYPSRTQGWLEATAIGRLSTAPDLLNDLVEDLTAKQESEGSWGSNIIATARAVQSLIAAGQGPKVSAFQRNWEIQKATQRQERSKPKLVRTVPIDPTAPYSAEIQTEAERLIKSATENLRINSLYIDMLYETIIDKQIANPDVDIRILTRGRDLSGNRQRIKKDVLDALIEQTDGSVREHHRLHSRMIISDQEAVMVSSADLTRDQLRDEFNAGILAHDNDTVTKAIEYFDQIWEEADHVNHM